MKRQDWSDFLKLDLIPALEGATYWIQVDNLDLHYDEKGLQMLWDARHLYWLQPDYSPEANPIEEAFLLLKAYLRGVGAKTVGTLWETLAQGVSLWTPESIKKWVDHSLNQVAEWFS